MVNKYDVYFVSGVSCLVVFGLTKTTHSLMCKLNILENNIANIKSRLEDLELFKLKVYNNEMVPGRRAWDEIDIDVELDDEEDIVD